MSRKSEAILRAIEHGPVTINYKSPELALHDRLTYYYHRRIAALSDPRALAVKIRLSGVSVILDFSPEDHPLDD